MAHFGSKIRSLRVERGWNQGQLAEYCGLHANTIRKIERTAATLDDLKTTTRKSLLQGFGITRHELEALYRPHISQLRGDPDGGIPIINCVPAGPPVDYEHMGLDNGLGNDYIPRIGSGVYDPTAFAFIVVGDSMTPEFVEGDTVVCSPETAINDGDAVFVRFDAHHDHTCTFKRVFDRGEQVELLPDNRRHTPLIVDKIAIVRMAKVVAKWVCYK